MNDMAKRAKYYRRRGRNYFLNLRIPDDLRSHFEGKTHFTDKLDATTDREAAKTAFQLMQRYEQQFSDIRRGFDITSLEVAQQNLPHLSSLTREEIDRMVLLWFFDEQDKMLKAANEVLCAEGDKQIEMRDNVMDDIAITHAIWRPHLGENRDGVPLDGANDDFAPRMRREDLQHARTLILESHGIDPQSDKGSELSDYLTSKIRAAYQELAFRAEPIMLRGVTSPKARDAFFKHRPKQSQKMTGVSSSHKKGMTLKQAYAAFFADKVEMGKIEAKTLSRYQSQLDFMMQFWGGDTPLQEITYPKMLTLLDALENYPVHAEKRYPKMSIKQRIAHAEKHLSRKDLLSYKSIGHYLSCYSRFFGYCLRVGYMDGKNPVAGLKPTIKRQMLERKVFTVKDLQRLFANPAYEKRFISQKNGEDAFWIPLLALFTGFRLSECCQLHCGDIKQEQGIYYIELVEDDERGEGKRKLKTRSSSRIVPIHPELIRLGFIDYWKRMSKGKEASSRLFPNIPFSSNKSPYRGFQRQFEAHVKKIGVRNAENYYVFHSFRHTASSSLINNGMDENSFLHNALMGWSNDGMRANYSKPSLQKLYETVQKICYEGLDLSHLYRDR